MEEKTNRYLLPVKVRRRGERVAAAITIVITII